MTKRMHEYHLTDETISEIERLAEVWECTPSDVIERVMRAGVGWQMLLLTEAQLMKTEAEEFSDMTSLMLK